jgi:hypothetical protein
MLRYRLDSTGSGYNQIGDIPVYSDLLKQWYFGSFLGSIYCGAVKKKRRKQSENTSMEAQGERGFILLTHDLGTRWR